MLLRLDDVSKTYGTFCAVNRVSLAVEAGARHAIIGPNGAGKTTLFNLVSGLTPPSAGSISFDGRPLKGMKPHEIVKNGMARSFQKVNIFPSKTVFENVQVALIVREELNYNPWRNPKGLFSDEVAALLGRVRLADESGRRAGELAYGKQKQLELAIALAAAPKMLLLDEPTAGMSIAETKASIALIREIADETGLTLLFTEHDMNVVFEIATSLSVLHLGAIVAQGRPEEVRGNAEVRRIYLGGH